MHQFFDTFQIFHPSSSNISYGTVSFAHFRVRIASNIKTDSRHIQAILTPLATRKAQLQRTLSAAQPNLPAKPSGSALAKGSERKPSHRLPRNASVEGRNVSGGKNLAYVLPVNKLSAEYEAKSSALPSST